MKFPHAFTIALLLGCPGIVQASGLAQEKRFEISGYLSMFSYGENIYVQTDIGGGINIFKYLNITANVNVGYRNYSLVTNDFFSVSLGKPIGAHEVRLGAVAGIYSVWLTGYQATFPCVGGEALYSYALNSGLSIRIKERVCNFNDNHHNLISTSTLIGLCFAFGSIKAQR